MRLWLIRLCPWTLWMGILGALTLAPAGCGGGGGGGIGGSGGGGGTLPTAGSTGHAGDSGATGGAPTGGTGGGSAGAIDSGSGGHAGTTGSGTGGQSTGSGGTAGVTGVAGFSGTGGAGGAVPPPTNVQDLCQLFCGRLAACDTARDQQTCVYTCRDSNSALFPNLRADLVAGIANCIQQDDCATIDKDTALGACLTQASASLAPSAAGTSFCSSQQTADSQCGVTTNQTDCLNSVKMYSEATIAQATACTSKSCSLIYSCTSATLGQATGGWALGGGIKPGQRCSGTAETCNYFSYSQTSCQAASCTYTASCTGTPYCMYESSSTSCAALTGCTWSTSSATCTGTSTVTCASFGSTACAQNVGCYLSSQCTGTTPACTTLTASSCAAHPGCMVVDAT